MHHFAYRDGVLHAEDVSLARIAAEVGTPFYCYATATIERHYRVLQQAFAGLDALICYAIKANSNQAVIATLARLGAGMDVVSEGELRRALAAGVPADRIIFAGVGKTREEMAFALREGIRRLQRGVRARAGGPERGGGGPRPHCPHRAARQPGRGRQDARQDLHRQGGEQVRRPLRRCAAALRQGGPAAGHRGGRRAHAHRQPDHRPRAVPRRLHADARPGGRAAPRRPRHRASRHRRRPRRALPTAPPTTSRPRPTPTPPWCARPWAAWG